MGADVDRGGKPNLRDGAAPVEDVVDSRTPPEQWTNDQVGSISFPDLVRAHYAWERATDPADELVERYRATLAGFQKCDGALLHAYWATRRPSAVALTAKPRGHRIAAFVTGDTETIRLHRVTDWLARERRVADLLHHCDALAIKVSEVLVGPAERIAMQWIYTVETHLIGFVERTQGRATPAEIARVVDAQSRELILIEDYYTRAGENAGRIVYFWGMLAGVVVSGALAGVVAVALWLAGWFDGPHTRVLQTFFACYVAGGLGAMVSVLMRMSAGKFSVDFEVGRPTIRRLGSFRPFIGAVFGVAIFFLLKSGIPQMALPRDPGRSFFFFGTLAFLAGFNERWTRVLFGTAERTVAQSLGAPADGDDADT